MSIFNLFEKTTKPIVAIGNVLDSLFTSDEERLSKKEALLRLQSQSQLAQTEINKIEAQHRSVFVAGWRPFIGWVCGFNLIYLVCLRDLLTWIIAIFNLDIPTPPALGMAMTSELIVALLGLGSLRTVEKLTGRSK
jgi:hypothetical protein